MLQGGVGCTQVDWTQVVSKFQHRLGIMILVCVSARLPLISAQCAHLSNGSDQHAVLRTAGGARSVFARLPPAHLPNDPSTIIPYVLSAASSAPRPPSSALGPYYCSAAAFPYVFATPVSRGRASKQTTSDQACLQPDAQSGRDDAAPEISGDGLSASVGTASAHPFPYIFASRVPEPSAGRADPSSRSRKSSAGQLGSAGPQAPDSAARSFPYVFAAPERDGSQHEADGPQGNLSPGQDQAVLDPWSPEGADWEQEEGEVSKALRGATLIQQMHSWKEMSDWLQECFDSGMKIYPAEIARMWTGLVQVCSGVSEHPFVADTRMCIVASGHPAPVPPNHDGNMQHHMGTGALGQYDEKVHLFPKSPIYSRDGRLFLLTLSRLTFERLQYTLYGKGWEWGKQRIRAPDAGRLLWAMGKLRWKHKDCLKLAESVIVRDFDCPWNRPRYMTTAMWGAAWAHPSASLKRLAHHLQNAPKAFWGGALSLLSIN